MYIIGIDGSGAYSRLTGVDGDMRQVGKHAGSSVNLKILSRDSVFDNVKRLVTEYNRLTNTFLSDCASVCIGAAGIESDADRLVMEEILKDVGFSGKIIVASDSEIVLAAMTKGSPGIVVIANTTSTAFALDRDGQKHRSGGWGHIIDDGGSGYQIGLAAIKRALMAADGRCEKTALLDKICSHFKLKGIEEIVNIVYSAELDRARIAEVSLIVKYVSAEGDKAAQEIEEEAARELSTLAISLITRTKMCDSKIVISGNVLQLNDNIRNKFASFVKAEYKDAAIIPVTEKPETGAVYLAKAALAGES